MKPGIIKPKVTLSMFVAIALLAGFNGFSKTAKSWAGTNFTSTNLQMGGQHAELPIAPERNPPGDIPDSQVFVRYTSAQGEYMLDVPEGWARTATDHTVTFQDKLDGLEVVVSKADKLPDVQEISKNQAVRLKKTGRAVIMRQKKHIKLSGMPVMLMRYESNSKPNLVTNKQVRLENSSYFYYNNGKLAELRLWAPLGADNVDQWRLISQSFKWR